MWRTVAFGALLCAFAAQVKAAPSGSPECAQFRQNIIDMENTSVRPPGWAKFDGQLRMAYVKQCLLSPTRKVPDEYWFRADGTPLGIRADYSPPGWDPSLPAWRPDGGAFIATPEIGAACAQTPNPSVCAMAKGIEADCRTPGDTQERNQCAAILNGDTPNLPPGEPLPAMSDWFGPARPGAPQMSNAQVWADPGFQRMCTEANANNNTCRQRQLNMRSIGTGNTGSTSQAGAFLECQQIYSAVLNMCHSTQLAAGVPDKPIPASPPPKPAPPQQAKAAPQPPPKSTTGGSQAPPPPSSSQMSPQCQQLVSNYIGAAQANDGARSLASYNALKGAGGCGVLDKVDRPMPRTQAPVAEDPRFVARGATPLSDQVVGGCDASPAECQRRIQQLRAGVSPEAQMALFNNAIGIGLQLATIMANGAALAAPHGGTNMNSIGNRPVQHTYGQGAPTYRTPRNSPSDITGTK
ncbi:MAG: hypothetical protein ACHQPH_06800 [Reyranellales bacterium]